MKARYFFLFLWIALLSSCSSTKNTRGTRWYHSFNTRYNVYFNGNEAYKEASKNQLEGYTENYSEMILMHPVSALPKDKSNSGGSFDKSIEKAVKAIKMHSIQTKPERKANKRNDPKYREFMSRTEYNPFLSNAWMLMARSQFYNGDFLEAASSFSYISRLYESQPEISILAKIWKARCYNEMDWFYEADDILSKLNINQFTKNESDWYSMVYTDYYVKQKQFEEAVPYMITAIRSEKNKLQRTRLKYLLGQMYATLGQNALAYQSFKEVSSSNAPYILELSARIRQTEVYPGGNIDKMTKQLIRMTKSEKNQEYLDQIYYALGNVYMTVPDTVKAIESYESGVEKSTGNGLDKTLNQIQLGDIYFNQRKYLNAQPNYSEALGQLKKNHEAYPRVSLRSEALDALVIHFEAVELQDSIQRLSLMPEEERMAVINKIIEDLIKKEKEEQEKAKRDEFQARQENLRDQQRANRPGTPAAMGGITPPGDAGSFYFYNSQVVAVGKNNFQQKWGRRNLEDDWRRRNRSGGLSDSFDSSTIADADNQREYDDSITDTDDSQDNDLAQASGGEATDPKDPQFYIQQLLVTEEDFIESDLIISNGLFNMGIIYKEMLENHPLALETFETLNVRFPDNENKEKAYYYSYLMHWKDDNMGMANLYKTKIRTEFPEGDLAIAMADPDYEYNQKRMQFVQDSIYQQTYTNYLEGKTRDVRDNYQWISTKNNDSKLIPKFMFLNALSFVQTNEADTFKILLNELIDKYPSEDVAALASEMMKGFQRGLLLSSSGDNMLARGSLFNMRFGTGEDDAASDSTLLFAAETAMPHELLLIYPKESLNDNLLLFAVASFNFGNFMINDFGLERTAIGEIGILKIKGFNNQEEVIQYLQRIQQPDGYAQEWGQTVVMVPISTDNYSTLMKGKSLEEYMTFFEKHFTQGNENLIAQWRLKQIEEMEVITEEFGEEKLLPKTDEDIIEETQTPESALTLTIDNLQPILQTDTAQEALPELPSTETVDTVQEDETLDTINTLYNKASDTMDGLSHTINEIASDPVRGILGLFKRKKTNNAIEEFAKQQEQEEKERQKQLKKEQQEKEKADRAESLQKEKERKELLKKQEEEEIAALKTKQQEQNDLAKQKALEKKQKEDEKKQQAAEKKRLAKEKEEARKAALKLRQEEQKAKEKARKEAQKQKEKERKERLQAQKKK